MKCCANQNLDIPTVRMELKQCTFQSDLPPLGQPISIVRSLVVKTIIRNVQGIGGEDPGNQTAPRAEAWAATVMLPKGRFNSVARFGTDASYVVDGVSKRPKLEKGASRYIWTLFLALLGMRITDLGIAKVTSHLEAVGTAAVTDHLAYVCVIIGNDLAD